jgi:hypothetical protein
MQIATKRLSSPNGSLVVMSGTDDNLRQLREVPSMSYQNHLSIPVEQQAMNYFLANWVLVPKPGQVVVTRGFLDYIVPLIKNEPPNSHLTASFEAVSLASLGNRPETKMLLGVAWQKYTRALSLVNRALAQPFVQKSDQTLAAVLLLGHFEVCSPRVHQGDSDVAHMKTQLTVERLSHYGEQILQPGVHTLKEQSCW